MLSLARLLLECSARQAGAGYLPGDLRVMWLDRMWDKIGLDIVEAKKYENVAITANPPIRYSKRAFLRLSRALKISSLFISPTTAKGGMLVIFPIALPRICGSDIADRLTT